jgi:hypothetical protein
MQPEERKGGKGLMFIQAILKALCFLFWIMLWALLAEWLASKLGLSRPEKLTCGIWSSVVGTGLWLILALK